MNRVGRVLLSLVGCIAAVLACGGRVTNGGNSGGNTNWLKTCAADADCPSGICAQRVCAEPCTSTSHCAGLEDGARCGPELPVASGTAPSCDGAQTVAACARSCTSDDECSGFGSDYRCEDGLCAPTMCASTASTFNGCTYEGRTLALGQQIVQDACTTCDCTAMGVTCSTRSECNPTGQALPCEHEGVVTQPGESYTQSDGCTVCVCPVDPNGGFVPQECDSSACSSTSGCVDDLDCDAGQVCMRDGDCSSPGRCEMPPSVGCGEIYAPVCACDGRTFGNECSASGRGLRHTGSCVGDGGCFSNDDCDSGTRCFRSSCDGAGECMEVGPALIDCSEPDEPVCGCDDVTYPNECAAVNEAGVGVAHAGTCGAETRCEADDDCGEFEYCQREACGDAGTCVPLLLVDCDAEYDPVCGCDGVTYGNVCEAAGRTIDYEGECSPGGGDPCAAVRDQFWSAVEAARSCTADEQCVTSFTYGDDATVGESCPVPATSAEAVAAALDAYDAVVEAGCLDFGGRPGCFEEQAVAVCNDGSCQFVLPE